MRRGWLVALERTAGLVIHYDAAAAGAPRFSNWPPVHRPIYYENPETRYTSGISKTNANNLDSTSKQDNYASFHFYKFASKKNDLETATPTSLYGNSTQSQVVFLSRMFPRESSTKTFWLAPGAHPKLSVPQLSNPKPPTDITDHPRNTCRLVKEGARSRIISTEEKFNSDVRETCSFNVLEDLKKKRVQIKISSKKLVLDVAAKNDDNVFREETENYLEQELKLVIKLKSADKISIRACACWNCGHHHSQSKYFKE